MMGVDLVPFKNNWAYLKTELSWLDRLLMLAIARQRKEVKAVNKVANNKADVVSSHWWKGVISVSKPAYDDCRVPPPTTTTKAPCKPMGYQQQLEGRIKRSAQDDIVLALPSLRHYLNLTLFEKNLLLLVLAPEVNRRYGRLYHYLHTGEDSAKSVGLPTVDLALRLLCRNDLERRQARARLNVPESLIAKRILHYVSAQPSTRLNSYLQLSDSWVNYLLCDQPDQHELFCQLATPPAPVLALPAPTAATRAVKITQPKVAWHQLIAPESALTQLQALAQRAGQPGGAQKGQVALLVGAKGTGKTMAARAIATSVHQPLCILDLAQVDPEHWAEILGSLEATRYPVLLIESAWVWFGRSSTLPKAKLAQWLHHRQAEGSLTLLSARYLHTVKTQWRQQMDAIATLPLPRRAARTMLWQQAFSGIICCDDINWALLAQQLKVAGGEIWAIADDAIAIAQAENADAVAVSHVQQALTQHRKSITQSIKL